MESCQQSADGLATEFGTGVYEVFGDEWQDGGDVLRWCLNLLQEAGGDWDSGSGVSGGFPASLIKDSCGGFAEVMAECGQQQFFLLLRVESVAATDACGLIADVQRVHPDITFRVPLRILWRVAKCVEFGEQCELVRLQESLQEAGRAL